MTDRTPPTNIEYELVVRDLGRMPYVVAHAMQKELQQEVIASRESTGPRPMYLLLVEHDPPVITISRRPGTAKHLLATPEQLAASGVEVCETDRGGDITYHGPGQLVVYPILDLNLFGLRVHSYMRFLEQVVIDTLAGFGVEGHRDEAATGVWVGGGSKTENRKQKTEMGKAAASQGSTSRSKTRSLPAVAGGATQESAKIAALGVRVSRWVSMHGLSLNVDPDLSHYDLIVPCGLTGRSVTSLRQELGERTPAMDEIKGEVVERFKQATGKMQG